MLAATLIVSLIAIGSYLISGGSPADATSSTQSADLSLTEAAADSGSARRKTEKVLEGDEVPDGMVYVPGGTTRIGIEPEELRALADQRPPGPRHMWGRASTPSFKATVDPFFLDVHPVTVAQFRSFVESTGFETQAERFGDAGVLDEQAGRWRLVQGATWRKPLGPDGPSASDTHPVTQVSWNDAEAYCAWKGRRLPTEIEWEHAARGAQDRRSHCSWGGACSRASRVQKANTWQGRFPMRNTVEDGYRYTSPVGAFGETDLGLQDLAGNVWEWTASWYRPYSERNAPFTATPRSERVQRGGSFLCHECGGFYVFARSHATPETSLFQVGFRCAKDAPSD